MIVLNLLFILSYFFIFFFSFKKISNGKIEYILFFICTALPIYFVTQVQAYQLFQNIFSVNIIKYSKDFIFFYTFLILIFGSNKPVIYRKFNLSVTDKIILFFTLTVFIYSFIPLGEAEFFSKLLYSKNIYIISIVYFIGRNIKIDDSFFELIKKSLKYILLSSSIFIFFEIFFSTHFHSLIQYAEFNLNVNEIDPQGNFGLNWTFESQNYKPRYAAFFADPLEFSSSLILFLSLILFSFYRRVNKNHFFLIILIFLSLYFSFSRGAIVACICIVLFSLILERKYSELFKIGIVVSFTFILTFLLSSNEFQYLVIDTLKFKNSSSLGHLIEWIEGILSIIDNPLGIGLAMSGNAGGVDQSLKVGGENQFLIFGVQMGILSIILYTTLILSVIIRSIYVYRRSQSTIKHISFIVACTKFGLLLPLLTANAELYLFVSLSTWFLAGNVESTYIKQLVEKKKSLY